MIRESLAIIIDAFEDFLEEKRIVIDNPEKSREDNEAIIFGDDFSNLESRIGSALKASGVHISGFYNETLPEAKASNDLVIFVPSQGELVKIAEGTGENLLKEDRADGYMDYLNWDRYDPAELGVSEDSIDGGMRMYKEYVSDKYSSLIDAVPDILKEAYADSELSFIVIAGGSPYTKEEA